MAAATATARTADAGVRGGWWAWAWTPPPPPRLEEEEGGRVMRQKKEKWRRQKADGCTPSLKSADSSRRVAFGFCHARPARVTSAPHQRFAHSGL